MVIKIPQRSNSSDDKAKTQTFITKDPLSQGKRVFVIGVPQGQSNQIDIDSAERMVDITDINPQGQALARKSLDSQHHGENAPTAV